MRAISARQQGLNAARWAAQVKCPIVLKNVESCYECLPWKEESQVNSPIFSHSIWRDELNAKKRITTAELALLIMREIRKHPECAHVMSVGFTRPPQRASGDPNWAPSWSMDGPKYRPGITEQIGRDFQNRFDLVYATMGIPENLLPSVRCQASFRRYRSYLSLPETPFRLASRRRIG
jgi:hypothetical protein